MKEVSGIEHILRGIRKAVKGKRDKGYIRELDAHKDEYASIVRDLLLSGGYRCAQANHAERVECGKLRQLTYTTDPTDIAVRFAVATHLSDVLVPKMHPGVCANIAGRGSLYCINRAKKHIQTDGCQYYLCEDVRKYFANMDVDILLGIVRQESGCSDGLLSVCREMLKLCESGVAIGTYDCQLWANAYLMPLDRFITERWPDVGYLRYCDNIYVFGNDIMELHTIHQAISDFLRCLRLRSNPCLFGACKDGCRVLSAVVYPTHTRLRRRVKEAMRRSDNVCSYFGHCKYADSKNLIRKIMYKKFSDLLDIPEYITSFTGDKRELDSLVGKRLVVTDCLVEEGKFRNKQGEHRERAKVAFKMDDGREYIFFSSSQPILHYCRHFLTDKAKYLPVELTVEKHNKQFKFAEYVEQD